MNRFKPYFCFAFKGGCTDEDDIPYYELNYCGVGSESFECFYIYDDYIYSVSSCREIEDLILEDGDGALFIGELLAMLTTECSICTDGNYRSSITTELKALVSVFQL